VQEYNGTVHWLDMYSEKDKKLSKRKMIELLGEQEDKNKFYRLKLEDYNC
jgi:hypothetical protein